MTYDEAESIIRRVLAGEFDHAKQGKVARNRLQTPDRTNATDTAGAVARAAREFLPTCRLRELTSMGGQLDYDENAYRELDAAELEQPPSTPGEQEGYDD
jgi:hypothetical protein